MGVYIVDGLSLVFRAYYAHLRAPLMYEGKNTSVVFGFFQSLFSYIHKFRPEYLVVAFDPGGKTFRHEMYGAYKEHRDAVPEDLIEQIPVVRKILDLLCVHSEMYPRYEADDVIASLVAKATAQQLSCSIISTDKDLAQLVSPQVRMLRSSSKGGAIESIDSDAVVEKWGVRPEQMRAYLALVGDSADNIPGVSGVGKVSAAKLLGEFSSLHEIYENLDTLSPSLQKKLEAGRESAMLSYELVKLEDALDIPLQLERYETTRLDLSAAREMFLQYGMKRLVAEFGAVLAALRPVSKKVDAKAPVSLHRSDAYELVTSDEALEKWLLRVEEAETFAFDTETDHRDPMRATLIGFSLADTAGAACYVPLRGPEGQVFEESKIRQRLQRLMANPRARLIGHNIKYDIKVLMRWGLTNFSAVAFDTMVAAWLVDSSRNGYGMDALAEHYLSYQTIHFRDLAEAAGKDDFLFYEVPLQAASQYAAEDADITFRLYEVFRPLLDDMKLADIFYNLEMPLTVLLSGIEHRGMQLEVEDLRSYSGELLQQLEAIEKKIYSLCGREFNVNSPKQLQVVLFEERGLTPVKKTKTGYSTDTDVLSILAAADPVPEQILRYRLLSKLRSTYLEVLPTLVHPETGRIHTNFQQTVAATGRLSSKDPNLQNIPIKDEEGRRVRHAFVPEQGWAFVGADYSQIELVVLAHFSEDEALCQAFRDGDDVHNLTASLVMGCSPDEVTAAQRRIAKVINFGVIYGMSAFRLSNELRIPRKQADEFIRMYFERYAGVRRFTQRVIEEAETNGFVRTLKGRIRPLANIKSKNYQLRSMQQRVAFNTVIQGSAADIIKQAMLDVDCELKKNAFRASMVLQVHDELLVEAPESEAAAIETLLTDAMEHAVSLSVPLKVKASTGRTWGALH